MKASRWFAVAVTAVAGLCASNGAQALVINLINTGGAETGTDAYRGFSAAAQYWQSVLTDDVTLNFRVGFTSAGFAPTTLGQTASSSGQRTQAAWRAALTADATTPLDAIATTPGNLATFANPNVTLNTSIQKALGLYTGTAAAIDASITFNSARAFDFDTRDGFTGLSSDFVGVAIHEMGHALGFTSAVGTGTTATSRPTNTDMFRYKNGVWDTTYGGDPYFSIDGGKTVQFNGYFSAGPDGYQTSHWREGARVFSDSACTVLLEPQIGIMDPTGGICQEAIVTAADLAIMDAMGWNLSTNILDNPTYAKSTSQIMNDFFPSQAPEPTSWAMMIVGFGLVGSAMRRRSFKVTFG